MPVGPPAGHTKAAPDNPEPPIQEPEPAGKAAPATRAAAPAAPPPEEASDAHGAETAAPASRAAAPSTPPARGTGLTRAPSDSPGAATAAGQGERKVPRPHQAQTHPHQQPKAVPAQGRLP